MEDQPEKIIEHETASGLMQRLYEDKKDGARIIANITWRCISGILYCNVAGNRGQ